MSPPGQWMAERMEAVYDLKGRTWALNEVRFTTTAVNVEFPAGPDASLWSQQAAAQMVQSQSRIVGCTRTFPAASRGVRMHTLLADLGR